MTRLFLASQKCKWTIGRRLIAIASGALTLSACVEALWSVNYSVEGSDGTAAHFVAPGPSDSVLLAGEVILPGDPETFLLRADPYVSRHSADGQLLWRYRPEDGTSFLGATSLSSAPDGSIYFTDMREDALVLTRLDADGNRVWEYRRPQTGDLFNTGLALFTQTLGTDRVLMGVTQQVDAANPPGTLVALNNQGEVLWEFNGIGSGNYDPAVRFTASVLEDGHIATFHSFSATDEQGRTGGAITVLEADGATLSTVTQEALGLQRIYDLTAAGSRIAVVGSTEQGSRLLVLGANLDVLQQRDFGAATTGRVAAQDDTLCFALLVVNEPSTDYAEIGTTTLGIIDRNGRATWHATQAALNSRAASLTVDNHRCAYSDMALLPPAGVEDGSRIQTQTQIFSAKGVLDTVTVAGDPGIANFGHTLLRGQSLYTASNVISPLSEWETSIPTATLYKHRVY